MKAVDQLLRSKGWEVVREIMEAEILASAIQIAEKTQMPLDEINFRRGSIWAGKQLLDLPTRLMQRLEADVRLEDSGMSGKSDDKT